MLHHKDKIYNIQLENSKVINCNRVDVLLSKLPFIPNPLPIPELKLTNTEFNAIKANRSAPLIPLPPKYVPSTNTEQCALCQNRGCICISSKRRTHRSNPLPSCIHSTFYKQNFPRKRGRDPIIQQFLLTSFYMVERLFWLDTSVSNNSLRVTTQIVQEIQKIPVIPCRLSSPARRNFILTTKLQQILQEEAHPMPLQHSYAYQADSRAVPSILYGRKSFCAPTVFPGLPVILPVETTF